MSICCDVPTITAVLGGEELIVGDHVQTSTALPTAGAVYKEGDLLVISAANVATLATAAGVFDAIAAYPLTVLQSTSHAATATGFGVYNQGEFNIKAVTLAGIALTPAQYQAAIACGTKRNIELRIPA